MLPHYSPLKVVETFRMLHALYPGRIDLVSAGRPAARRWRATPCGAIAASPKTDDFPQQLAELQAFLKHSFPAQHPFGRIKVSPDMPGAPEVWMLGSSMWSASAAAQLGLPYAFAHFINQHPTRMALEYYREHFKPSQELAEPQSILALGAICADTEHEALRLLSSSRLFRNRIRRGELGPIPTPEEAIAELGPDQQRPAAGDDEWPRYIVGDPEQVRAQLVDMASVLADRGADDRDYRARPSRAHAIIRAAREGIRAASARVSWSYCSAWLGLFLCRIQRIESENLGYRRPIKSWR